MDLICSLRKSLEDHVRFVLSNWKNGDTIHRDWEDWKKEIKSSAYDVLQLRCLLNITDLFS